MLTSKSINNFLNALFRLSPYPTAFWMFTFQFGPKQFLHCFNSTHNQSLTCSFTGVK